MPGLTLNILAFFIAFLYANAGEWFFHRYILHGLGNRRESFFSYHWHEHHRVCREQALLDPGYRRWPRSWNAQAKELFVLTCILLFHLPLFFVIPGFAAGFCLSIALYYFRHRRSHIDPDWANVHLRWHYDHHLSREPESANWCITWPWFDYVMGTRIKKN